MVRHRRGVGSPVHLLWCIMQHHINVVFHADSYLALAMEIQGHS